MGIRNALRLHQTSDNVVPFPQIASPWAPTPSHLQSIVWSDIFDRETRPLNRDAAMRVPAVARARHLVAPTIARLPLTVWRSDVEVTPGPSWISRSKIDASPFHRMLWTIDDLIFYGWSLWIVERGASGQVLDAARIPYAWWDVEDDGRIMIQLGPDQEKRPAAADEVVLIPGFHEGIVNFGVDAIRQAAALAETARERAEHPAAMIDLHYTGDNPMTEDQIDALVDRWIAARNRNKSGVGFTNKLVEARELGTGDTQLLIEGRNAAAVEVARVIGLPAAMIDAVTASAGLEYNTGETRNAQFIDYGLAAYMESVTARLSADDVVPQGQSVRFDTSTLRDLAPAPTGPITED